MKTLADISQARLKEMLSYDPETGVFKWIKNHSNKKPGDVAGTRVTGGYVSIGLDQKYYKAHRLAWLYVHGCWPAELIDHIDGDCGNNRIANLREASASQNIINRPAHSRNKTGFKGVFFNARKTCFVAATSHNNKNKHLGTFKTAEEASNAYRAYITQTFGEFAHSSVRVPILSTGTRETE